MIAPRKDHIVGLWDSSAQKCCGQYQKLVNLLLLKGSIEKGAGTCPVRGHSNVQGDRTMGIWEKPKDAFRSLRTCVDFKALELTAMML